MSILVGRDTRLVVQGITGREGEFHSRAMLEYGTPIVSGVTPGQGRPDRARRARARLRHDADAVRETGANTTCIYVPAAGAPDAIMEALGAGIATIFCITEGIPALDMLTDGRGGPPGRRPAHRPQLPGGDLAGPGQGRDHPGVDPPRGPGRGRVALGDPHLRGRPGDDRRRDRPVDLRRDRRRPDHRHQFVDILELFAADPETDAIVLIGEIGGAAEEEAAAWAKAHLAAGPMAAFIAGRTAPEGRRMGHAGAIISGGAGTAAGKVAALEDAGIRVAGSPTELPALLRDAGYN